jgi:hypothetical protein
VATVRLRASHFPSFVTSVTVTVSKKYEVNAILRGLNDGIVNSFPGEQLFQTSTNQGDFESEFARKLTAVSDNFNAKLSASDNWNAFQPPQ